jgi:hypothetical protein
MILKIGLPGNQTGNRSVTVVWGWNRGLLARSRVQRRHPVMAWRKSEESASASSSDGASAALDAFRQRLFGLFEGTSNVVDADAASVVLKTSEGNSFKTVSCQTIFFLCVQ